MRQHERYEEAIYHYIQSLECDWSNKMALFEVTQIFLEEKKSIKIFFLLLSLGLVVDNFTELKSWIVKQYKSRKLPTVFPERAPPTWNF